MKIFRLKYTIYILPLVIGIILITLPQSSLAIVGKCVNCHTMHNSQNGEPIPGNPTPNPMLLKGKDCLGCHGNDVTDDPIKLLGDSKAPCVYVNDPTKTQFLAGGNFKYMDDIANPDADTYGHNCNVDDNGISNDEDINLDEVPGFTSTWNLTANPLTCAGTYGCHGIPAVKGTGEEIDRWDGIKGAHHSNKGGARTDAAELNTVGGGYRFLLGIAGYEDPNWQMPDSMDDDPNYHNEYKGSTDGVDTTTISYLCAKCHGIFHANDTDPNHENGIGDRSEPDPTWFRHPTDFSLPHIDSIGNPTEYASYYEPENTLRKYSVVAPVGRTIVDAPSATVDPTGTSDDIVTCISCHRAHGTDQPDLLRWNYDDMIAGDPEKTGGCFICHTGKNN